MVYKHEVDIDKADSFLKFMAEYVERPEVKAELNKVEVDAKEPLYGLILTGVLTGLFPNIPSFTGPLREKLFMAFHIGFYYGRELRR